MRRRNRKKQTDGFIFPVPFAAILVLGSILALSYLWLDGRCEAIEKEIKVLETEEADLARTYAAEQSKWAHMKTPPNIEKALRRHKMCMVWPDEGHIVRLPASNVETWMK